MTVVPPGSFIQGSAAEGAEQPPHLVSIVAPIALAPREVTIGEFEEFATDVGLQARGCNVYDGEWRWRAGVRWDTVDDNQTALHPVTCVSGMTPLRMPRGYRRKPGTPIDCPARRNGNTRQARASPLRHRSGSMWPQRVDTPTSQIERPPENIRGGKCSPATIATYRAPPVASFAANAFHLHDMIGNVFEWVQDCWQPSYVDAPTDGAARENADCTQREMRGGSWFTSPAYLRASYRNRFEHSLSQQLGGLSRGARVRQ